MKPILKNTTILITGASSGMGKELAGELAREANNIVLVARRKIELDAFAETLRAEFQDLNVYPIPCDLADLHAVRRLTSRIHHDIGQVDVLINAAGIGQTEFLENAPLDEIDQMVHFNVLGLTYLCRAFLPSMIEQGSGGILNFSSFFGLKVLPGYTAYAGSKHYVTGFTEALRAETAGTGVVVSTVYPGPVRSAFWNTPNADLLGPPSFLFLSVQQCARATLRGFCKGKARIVPGLRIKLFLLFLALTPAPIERFVNAVLAKMLRAKIKKIKTDSFLQEISGDVV